ncbi:MAG: phosphoglycerate dehydrogenase [Coriobacteriales bacterium]|jgi:D-3-phosphoglycerate dehydrogenase|nr:phosphoglycerate dehydrogenase [Coriobacteriales bacterium]
MKVLVAEKLADTGLKILKDAGHEVDVKMGMSPEELIATIPDYEALIIRSATKATREVIEAGHKLKIIGRAGVGVDNVDVEAATERGVIVCNAPTSNIVSAAEQTMTMLLATARRTAAADASMKAHKWDRGKFTGNELYKKTLAIFGLGRIGGLIAARAKSFEMNLIGYDPYCPPERAEQIGVKLYDNMDDIFPLADFITVHMPKTKETTNMFSTEQFAKMKDGVYVVNVARGGIYDLEALAEAIKSGKVAGCGIDVWENEPVEDSPLHSLEQATLTPHLGASTVEAQARAGEQIAEYVNLGLAGKMVPTALNVTLVPEDVMSAVAPFVDACETAGQMLAQVTSGAISAVELNVGGDLAKNDVDLLATSVLRGVFSVSNDDPVNLVNASYIAEQRGISVSVNTDPARYDYTSVVQAVGITDKEKVEVSCTVSGSGSARIVSVRGYRVDFVPGKNVLVMVYADEPGKLGKIGTVLGDAGINISTMNLGVKEDSGEALVLMNVDKEIPDDVYEDLANKVAANQGWRIELSI